MTNFYRFVVYRSLAGQRLYRQSSRALAGSFFVHDSMQKTSQ
jgi:hypothetical protein